MNHDFGTIKEYFEKYKILTVPYYQRSYVWHTANSGRNLYKFIDDICNEYKSSEQSTYFIGSLAFCSHDNVCDIVDGQQRITTLIMFLSILAENYCSTTIKLEHEKLVYPNGKDNEFIIQEPFCLTKELQGILGYKPYNGTGPKLGLDATISKIKNQINKNLSTFTTVQYDNLYKYALNNLTIISVEYGNVKDALRYFLNINSLSVELRSHEIFYTILSQALNISHNSNDIHKVTAKISSLVKNYKGLKTPEDIIYIFLNAYYSKDTHINELPENILGVGKWMSYYKTDVFGDQLIAKDFCEDFLQYIDDLEQILKYFNYQCASIDYSSPLYLSYILLKYQNFDDLLEFLIILFKRRHNYVSDNIYEQQSKILSINELESISKRLNLVIIHNYIRASNKRLDGFTTSIDLDSNCNYKLTTDQIINNISLDDVFNLAYVEQNSFQSNPHVTIKDESRLIKVILCLQEAFLNSVSNPSNSLNRYFGDLLDGQKFTIEHLYSVKEWSDIGRQNTWYVVKRFDNPASFDIERSKFENLSLLNWSSNSAANDDEIYDKMNKYSIARSVLTTENELLIQSLVPDSPFYKDPNIKALNLPDRTLRNIFNNSWEHSPDNKQFIRIVLFKALEAIK